MGKWPQRLRRVLSPLDPEAIDQQSSPTYSEASRGIGRKRKRSQDAEDLILENQGYRQLRSPSTGNSHDRSSKEKKKRAVPRNSCWLKTYDRYQEKVKLSQQTLPQPDTETYNPVAYWAQTHFWPRDLQLRGFGISDTPSNKRRSESTHRSQTLERMAAHGVFMKNSNLIQTECKSVCRDYLKGGRTDIRSSVFTAEQFSRVLGCVRNLNGFRLTRDVTPWIVPSVEVLFYLGELKLDYVGEDLSAKWVRCATMRAGQPKPAYTAGLLSTAFSEEEKKKLEHYANPSQPFRFTQDICFPFLICEAKTGEKGLNEAERQNTYCASIAVRAIIALYQKAFGRTAPDRVQKLYGKILVFTVSHDND